MSKYGKNGKVSEYFNGYEANQGDKVSECYLCGDLYPDKVMRNHWKLGKLVCPLCNDVHEDVIDKGEVT